MKIAASSEDLNQDIYDSVVVARYRTFTSRIANFKLKDSFDYFVYNALSSISDIIHTKGKDAHSLDELAVILSDFPQLDELLRMPDYRDKLGFQVASDPSIRNVRPYLSSRVVFWTRSN